MLESTSFIFDIKLKNLFPFSYNKEVSCTIKYANLPVFNNQVIVKNNKTFRKKAKVNIIGRRFLENE